MNKKLKKLLIFVAGLAVGSMITYGYLWLQVYQHFNNVWTCQVFTGQLSVHEAEHCKRYKDNKGIDN